MSRPGASLPQRGIAFTAENIGQRLNNILTRESSHPYLLSVFICIRDIIINSNLLVSKLIRVSNRLTAHHDAVLVRIFERIRSDLAKKEDAPGVYRDKCMFAKSRLYNAGVCYYVHSANDGLLNAVRDVIFGTLAELEREFPPSRL